MVDLDDLLLEAAGRTNAPASSRSRHSHSSSSRRREGSYSDGGSEESDEEDRGYPATRKPSASQVPLKKRLEAEREAGSDREGDSSSSSSSEESDFGDDLYKNEEDRQKLAGMTEFQREMILAERADKKGDKSFTEKLRSKRENEMMTTTTTTPVSKKDTHQTPPAASASRGVRSSARSADRAAAKDDALNELRAKRMKQQDPSALRKLRDASSKGGRDFSSMKRKPSLASLSDSDRSQSDDEGSNGGMGDSDDDRSDVPTYEDIKEITIRRSKLAKWFMEPFFEELIVGCFVRVGIGRSKSGPIYRLCMVKNVDAADPDKAYKLENKTTHKYLNVFWGNETSAARWQMAMISDGHPVEEEYRQWIREVERTNDVAGEKSASARPMNIAAEKDRLRKELEIAESKNDGAGVERIKAKIKQLDASRNKKGVDKKALKLFEMNKKNRAENFKNASEVKSITASLKAGEAGYDPFSRRWTRSSNYYNGKNSGKDGGENEAAAAAAVETNGADAGGENGVEATEAALEAAAEAGKLIDTRAPIGQGAEHNLMHNFELPLSLAALQKYGGPQGVQKAFMARKQVTEATVGCRVVENDGKRHGLTLTVSDYKRRRGLL
ncbi:Protein RTF1-like protein [Raphanus sativus]|nr:Protein RTF1-like protein [Raphanus sativus]